MAHNAYLKYVQTHIKGLTRSEMQVLCKLCAFMLGEKSKKCLDASIDTMAGWFFVSRATVKRAVQSLEELGLINRVIRQGQTSRIIFGEYFWDGFHDHRTLDFSKCKGGSKCTTIEGSLSMEIGGVNLNQGGVNLLKKGGQNEPQSELQDITRISSNSYKRDNTRHFANPYTSLHSRLRLVARSKSTTCFPPGVDL